MTLFELSEIALHVSMAILTPIKRLTFLLLESSVYLLGKLRQSQLAMPVETFEENQQSSQYSSKSL